LFIITISSALHQPTACDTVIRGIAIRNELIISNLFSILKKSDEDKKRKAPESATTIITTIKESKKTSAYSQ